ncbi:ABC transporter substrate-binding protein [Paenibacillus mucilaginosus]|uniref:ABC transporter substrate binding protein n=1 Tax=Paenibacillus mucilaginosus (strain KNP414) TaxID=1036673 RepID=F8FNA4_PAEMK|nr:ABC transporter substrate-binding protein [Paenibacillus mucilaginosus]AEI38941.1 ABC transporter substrate binding protein [Paenibacillus mucilaginosus KNP414]MCG7216564.1 ABC transporter substrate-binding protein [Paenibacillus mucilaginosus]WDM27991.1 ABC transporter substrate-binding protein [Paenibacillus mucilaginosus]
MKPQPWKTALAVMTVTALLTGCTAPESGGTDVPAAQQPAGSSAQPEIVKDAVIPASDKSKSPTAATARTDTVVVSLTEPGGVFNPYFYQNGYDGNVTSVMFSPLVNIDENGKPVPDLAEKWEISPDGLVYTYYLRPNLKFSDGSPLTAEDVAFTLTLLHDKAYDGETDLTETHIKGGQAYKEGKADAIEGIQVIDPLTIRITTEKVNARSLLLLGGQPLSKAYYGKNYAPGQLDYLKSLHAKPLATGPYKYDQYIPGQEVRFTANEHYYGGKPKVEHFIYKTTEGDATQFFQTGETDYSSFTANPDNLDLLKQLGYANINIYTSTAYSYIKFNHSKAPFKDKRVRQAFVYGLDRAKIVQAAYQGYAQIANVPVSPVSWAYTEEGINPYPYDPEKAKKLLDEAGWKPGADGVREKDGQKLIVRYFTTKGAVSDILIPIAKENYKALGIQLESELMDYNALLARTTKGDHDLASFSTTLLPDPSDGVNQFSSKAGGSFTGTNGYSNPKVDELIEKGTATLDLAARKAAYAELYKEIAEDPPFIFLAYRKILSAHNARVEGFRPNGYTGLSSSLPNLEIK